MCHYKLKLSGDLSQNVIILQKQSKYVYYFYVIQSFLLFALKVHKCEYLEVRKLLHYDSFNRCLRLYKI